MGAGWRRSKQFDAGIDSFHDGLDGWSELSSKHFLFFFGVLISAAMFLTETLGSIKQQISWPIYNDLSRGHPKWWFSKGIPPKMALN